jgi:hypothetical protein
MHGVCTYGKNAYDEPMKPLIALNRGGAALVGD